MKRFLFNFLTVLIIVTGFSLFAPAQIEQTKNAKLIAEVIVLRSKLVEAIKQRDQKMLEKLSAIDFTHPHATGQVDDQTKRIAALVAGDSTIESADPDE